MSATPHHRTAWILGLLAGAAAIAAAAMPPVTQDPAYHQFADPRPVLGVPHGWNVLSNAPFLLIGLLGVWHSRRVARARAAWLVAFSGIALVAFGSAWYHLAPSTETLVWDRLPMTVGFTGLAVAVLEPHLGPRATRVLLGPAVTAGLASVGYWQWTGDLRPYVWVQFAPLLLMAASIIIGRHQPAALPLLAALVLYGVAKGFEAADASFFGATSGLVSGHPLKHLAAAAACLALVHVADRSRSLLECEVDGHGHDDRHRLAVEQGRLVLPQ